VRRSALALRTAQIDGDGAGDPGLIAAHVVARLERDTFVHEQDGAAQRPGFGVPPHLETLETRGVDALPGDRGQVVAQ